MKVNLYGQWMRVCASYVVNLAKPPTKTGLVRLNCKRKGWHYLFVCANQL